MATLRDKTRDLEQAATAVDYAVGKMESGNPGPWTWETVEKAVGQALDALRAVRSTVRARARKEKRASCTHPERKTFQDGSGYCRACRLTFKAPEEAPKTTP